MSILVLETSKMEIALYPHSDFFFLLTSRWNFPCFNLWLDSCSPIMNKTWGSHKINKYEIFCWGVKETQYSAAPVLSLGRLWLADLNSYQRWWHKKMNFQQNVNAEDSVYLLKFLFIFVSCKWISHVGKITWGIWYHRLNIIVSLS